MKKVFLIFNLILAILFLPGCSASSTVEIGSITKISASPNLKIFYFDIGQGDSELIITPSGKTILIDGGPDDKILSKLGAILPIGQKKIDTMILTHPHADHLEGLIPVLRRYEVGEIYYTGVLHTTNDFLIWLKLIKEKQITMHLVNKQNVVDYETDLKLNFLWPNKDLSSSAKTDVTDNALNPEYQKNNSSLNNTSIVFKMAYKNTSFLFVGDAEIPVEKELLKQNVDLKADVLKVGHHGSHSSTSEEFLTKVSPKIAVISVGKNNDFGHPHLRTLRRLERHNVKIYRTDQGGDVEIESNGVDKIIKK